MTLRPMPRDWHQRASWRAKQQRRDALRRLVADLSRTRYAAPVTVLPDPDGPRHMRELGQALGVFCAVEDCQHASRAHGLCSTHVKRMQREQVAA